MNRKFRPSFSSFRFVIAAILLIAAGFKAYQLATEPMIPAVRESIFLPLLELFSNRILLIVAVNAEILFALVLLAGLWQKWTWLASLLCFTFFTLVSGVKGLSGESTCGCLGTVAINPWIMAVFDISMVGLLFLFRERGAWGIKFSNEERRKGLIVSCLWLVLAAPLTVAMTSVREREIAELGTEFVGVDGGVTVMLEPEKWAGKRFPLWDHVDEASRVRLVQGTWTVVLVRKQCDSCRQLLEKLADRGAENLVVLELVDDTREVAMDNHDSVALKGTLQPEPHWIVLTPVVVKCREGICVAAGEDSILP